MLISETRTLIEIKSILSLEKEAYFPGVFSQRAIDQLKIIEKLLKEGYKVVYILVSLNKAVKRVCINKAFKEYYSLFVACMNRGMLLKGYKISIKENGPIISGEIDILV